MKKAITDVDIEAGAENGTFVVTREMVLTPGAREYASRNSISVRYGAAPPSTAADPISDGDIARIVEQIVITEVQRAKETPPPPVAPAVSQAAAMDSSGGQPLSGFGKNVVLNAHGSEEKNRAIVTVVGQNQAGVVARISAVVAECGGDLADISQVIIDDYFSMIFIVGLEGLDERGISFRVFKEKLQDEATRIGQTQVLVMHEGIFKAMHKV
jgi:ACT domain-containing protein